MRVLGNPLDNDPRLISGESGAAGLGLLYHLRENGHTSCEAIELNKDSRVLIISTEGDTDVENYRDIVWNGKYSM